MAVSTCYLGDILEMLDPVVNKKIHEAKHLLGISI
jgi:hypothetical protein